MCSVDRSLYRPMKQNPCYKCEDRRVGCHGVCERYNEWSSARSSHREKVKEEKIKERAISYYYKEKHEKERRKEGKK